MKEVTSSLISSRPWHQLMSHWVPLFLLCLIMTAAIYWATSFHMIFIIVITSDLIATIYWASTACGPWVKVPLLFVSWVYKSEWEELWSVFHRWKHRDTNNLNNLFTFSQLVNKGAGIETQPCLMQGANIKRALILSRGPHPHDLITSQRLHLLTPSH